MKRRVWCRLKVQYLAERRCSRRLHFTEFIMQPFAVADQLGRLKAVQAAHLHIEQDGRELLAQDQS